VRSRVGPRRLALPSGPTRDLPFPDMGPVKCSESVPTRRRVDPGSLAGDWVDPRWSADSSLT
jgi:hypothetical protein